VLGVGTGPGAVPVDPTVGRRAEPLSLADREALAVLVSVQRLGPITLDHILAQLGSPSAVLDIAAGRGGADILLAATRDPESEWRSMPRAVAEAIVDAVGRRAEILAGIERLGLRVVAIGDPAYPERLRAIEIPPAVLFVRGEPGALSAGRSVAVVGTRRPTEAGRRIASRIAAGIARAGGLVVSGLAVGIDGAAHAAVVAERAPTVAFIGSGHARLFPPIHDRLADAIVDAGGAIVSEYAPETEPTKGTFPRRNRLISGAADAVVVVEAGARSGALLTASWALEQGRDCFVVPGPIDAPASAGCLGFLRDWPGLVRIVAGVPQLLEDLGLAGEAAFVRPEGPPTGPPSSKVRPTAPTAILAGAPSTDRSVATAILAGAAIVDEIVAVTSLAVGAVLGALTRLESAGLVVGTHGRYRVAGPLAASEPRSLGVQKGSALPPAA
jgi:DNA processing protein